MSRRTKTRRTNKNQSRRAAPSLGKRGRLALPILIAVALVVCILGSALLFQRPAADTSPSRVTLAAANTPQLQLKSAAIVDQLDLTHPNPAFAQVATAILEQAGYTVAYFSGQQITVDFFRNLPGDHYDLIVLRVHLAFTINIDRSTGQRTSDEAYASVFTNQPYSEMQYPEERDGHLGAARYYADGPAFFGIASHFITRDMQGSFDDTLVIMMGCSGLRTRVTAQAFLDKGARAVVGWNEDVSAGHTDAATQRLLEQLFVEGLPVSKAIAQTMAEVGADPAYGAELQVLFAAE